MNDIYPYTCESIFINSPAITFKVPMRRVLGRSCIQKHVRFKDTIILEAMFCSSSSCLLEPFIEFNVDFRSKAWQQSLRFQ